MEVVDFLFMLVVVVTVLVHIVQDFWLVCYIVLATIVYIVIKNKTKQSAIKIKGDGCGVFITGCDSGKIFSSNRHDKMGHVKRNNRLCVLVRTASPRRF